MSAWNDDRVAALKTMWADGLPVPVIAYRLGVSRNSIIGKAYRLGLPGRGQSNQPTAKKRHRNPDFGKPLKSYAQIAQERAAALARYQAIASAPEPDIPKHQRKTILVRRAGKLWANNSFREKCCRWPLQSKSASGMMEFCGREKQDSLSYCEAHAARAFSPVRLSQNWLPATHFPQGGPTDRTRELAAFDEMGEKGGSLPRVKESA